MELPCEIITHIIIKHFFIYKDLLHLKTTCKYFDNLVSAFYVNKSILECKLSIYTPRQWCANYECYDDTCEIYEDIYYHGYRRYTHSHQYALNDSVITVNKKKHNINTPYCCECFKKHILIGDNHNIVNHLVENRVYIEYL
jgi:hypothetical protein